MAKEVRQCLNKVQFGGKPCSVIRGIVEENNFIFNDEGELLTFLAKTEDLKNGDMQQYEPVKNTLWEELTLLWKLDPNFVGTYSNDYQMLENSFNEEGERTCWSDKYSTTFFNPEYEQWGTEMFTPQPIPAYVRWLDTGGELHYLPIEKLHLLKTEVVNETPSAYLPSKVLDMVFKVFKFGINDTLPAISFICWCTEDEVVKFLELTKEKLDKSYQNEKEKEYWSQDDLYKTNDKATLQKMCKEKNLPTEGKKHELVKFIVEKEARERPSELKMYNGDLCSVPALLTDLKKMSVYKLREILRFHNVWDCGTKDELVIRV